MSKILLLSKKFIDLWKYVPGPKYFNVLLIPILSPIKQEKFLSNNFVARNNF